MNPHSSNPNPGAPGPGLPPGGFAGLSCRECVIFLMAYLDNELPAPQRNAFEVHLSQCPPCVEYLKQYQSAVALGKAACGCGQKPQPLPADMVKAILAATREPG